MTNCPLVMLVIVQCLLVIAWLTLYLLVKSLLTPLREILATLNRMAAAQSRSGRVPGKLSTHDLLATIRLEENARYAKKHGKET
jgi:hypothetical protein